MRASLALLVIGQLEVRPSQEPILIMSDWFSTLAAGSELPMGATSELQERGFVVIPGPTRPDLLANAYTAAVASATSDDIRIGSTSTKVNDFVNRGAEFDNLYVFPPLLEAWHEGQSDSGSERGRPTPVGNSSALVRPRRSVPPLAGSERRGRNECSWDCRIFVFVCVRTSTKGNP